MKVEITSGTKSTTLELAPGHLTLGGDDDDDILVRGLDAQLLRLHQDAGNLRLVASARLRIGGAPFPINTPRLLLPGETIELGRGHSLHRPDDFARRDARMSMATANVARELLGSGLEPEKTRAASLTCVSGPDEGLTFSIAFEELTLGRADDSHVRIRLRDRTVSRRHAVLRLRNGACFVEPLTTSNDTLVNGSVIRVDTKLNHGDLLEAGHSFLRFEAPESTPLEKTTLLSAEELLNADGLLGPGATSTPRSDVQIVACIEPEPARHLATSDVDSEAAARALETIPPSVVDAARAGHTVQIDSSDQPYAVALASTRLLWIGEPAMMIVGLVLFGLGVAVCLAV
jgi:pSer/pThr/pTyr-binding forkhead associated (FHA) protein